MLPPDSLIDAGLSGVQQQGWGQEGRKEGSKGRKENGSDRMVMLPGSRRNKSVQSGKLNVEGEEIL